MFEGETSDRSTTVHLHSIGAHRQAVRPAGSRHTIGVLREHTGVVSDLAVRPIMLLRCPVMGCGGVGGGMVCVV